MLDKLNKITSKVDCASLLKQLFREHIVTSTLLSTLANGFSIKGLENTRNTISMKLLKRFKKKVGRFIPDLQKAVEKEYSSSNVIKNATVWVLWLQGEENAPLVVQHCLASLRRWLPDWNIVVLDEITVWQYISLPNYILEKYRSGIISRTHLSDLIRLELLTTRGGVWVDATVWLSARPSNVILCSDFFIYQTLKPGLDGLATCASTWWITAQKPSRVLLLAKMLLYAYWKTYDYMFDYYLIHYALQVSIDLYSEEWADVVPVSNETPHILLLNLFDAVTDCWFESVCDQTSVHKLSYKNKPIKSLQADTVYARVFKENMVMET